MPSQTVKTERLHALDSARAIMMMLGLVIHAAITYRITIKEVWPLKDPLNTSIILDYVYEWIHLFRMPAFFVIAGFFGALLFYERSPRKMIINRINRVVWPFVVFVFILYPLVVFPASFSVFKAMGQPASIATIWELRFEKSLLPDLTMHLWFLYYLIMISAVFWLLSLILMKLPAVTKSLSKLFVALNKNTFVRPLHMAVGVFLALYAMDTYTIITSAEWIPNPATFFMYAMFYGYGWTLFNSKYLLPSFVNHAWLLFAAGMVSFAVLMHLLPRNDERAIFVILMALAAISISLFVFSIIGLFLKYASNHSPRMRYISDASYWVYCPAPT